MNKTNDFKFNLPGYTDAVDVEDLNDNFRGIDDALMAGLCKKDYTGNNMGSSDPSARKYAWAPWLEIVNDNEFDVVVTDRNAPVESEEATINIAAGQTFRKYINGRYYMNFYVQDQHDVTFKWFTNAETYINESGGGGGTGTVTSVSVQGGSGSHLTGSGNPIETSGTITINVDDGYSIPSDNEQTAWDGKAADLKAEIDSSTYVLTLQLKDSSGNLIGTAKTIDLPLETMVVDGEYDSQTKKIKLELKNGNYVEFSVADLVSGLQTELSASNKLDPDYIDYDSNHRAVSDTEKNTWNSKQNAISDLATIRSGATAGATAVQPSAMQTALSTKQDSLDSTQLAAVNSGINSTKVAQISTNQSNILYGLNTGVKNIIDFSTGELTSSVTTHGVTWTTSENKGVVANGTSDSRGSYPAFCKMTLPVGTYKISGGTSRIKVQLDSTIDSGSGATFTVTSSTSQPVFFAVVAIPNATFSNETIYPMVCTEEAWNQSHDYQPPALPNYDLTYLEAQDRASLAEVVDSGAKNLFDVPSSATIDTITWTADSNSYITASPNNTDTRGWGYNPSQYKLNLKAGTYVCVLDIKTASSQSGLGLAMYSSSGTNIFSSAISQIQNKTGIVTWKFTISTAGSYGIEFKCYDMVARIMICTKAAFGVSQKFVPYVPTLYQVDERKAPKVHGAAVSSGDLNDINESDFRIYTTNVANHPESAAGFVYVRTTWYDENASLQEAFTMMTGNSYVRVKWNGTWKAWKRLDNV